MFLQYNTVNLRVVKLNDWTRESVYTEDHCQYLYTEHTVSVQAVYATDAAANRLPGFVSRAESTPGQLVIGIGSGSSTPVTTDLNVRSLLATPRGKLLIWDASDETGAPSMNQMIVECPVGTAPNCLINGPHPVLQSIEEVRGVKTYVVVFSIKFALNEAYAGGQAPMVLSNRWTSFLSYDENYNFTRKITGTAVLRADLLKTNGFEIDAFREVLLPCVGDNAKRFIDELIVLPDGHTYNYSVRDVEQPLEYLDKPVMFDSNSFSATPFSATTRPNRNVTSIQGYVRRTAGQQGSNDIVAALIQNAESDIAYRKFQAIKTIGFAGSVASVDIIGAFNYGVGAPFGEASAANASTLTRLQLASAALPTVEEEVVVIIQGNKSCKRSDLQFLAYSIAFGQLSGPTNTYSSLPTDVTIRTTASAGEFITGLALRPMPVANSVTLQYELTENKVTVVVKQSLSGFLDWTTNRTSFGINALINPIPDNIVGGNWRGVLQMRAVDGAQLMLADAAGENFTPRTGNLPDFGNLIIGKRTSTSITPEDVVRGKERLTLLAPSLFGPNAVVSIPYSSDPVRWVPPATSPVIPPNGIISTAAASTRRTVPLPNTLPPGLIG